MKNNSVDRSTLQLEKTDIIPFLIWMVVFFMTWLFMHDADRYLLMTPEALGKYFKLRWIIITHITAGGGALITGIVQFWPKLRNYSWKLHRLVGTVYLLAVLASSICALILAFTTAYKVNWAYAFTLQIWAGVWITATFIAYYTAIKKNIKLHKEWMTRSYILTVSFLISGFALKLPYIQTLGTFEEIGTPLFWMGWSVPLFVYEVIKSSNLRLF